MQGQWKRSGQVMALLLVSAVAALAQTPMLADGEAHSYPSYPGAQAAPPSFNQDYGRMAYPGAVNYVEGQVMLNGQALSRGAVGSAIVGPNQAIDTSNGYAELLLTPGAFLRIGHNSEVRVVSAGLAGMTIELTRGSAMIEAADLVKGSQLEVRMNGATARIEQRGLYAFDADQHSVRVLDGKAQVTENAGVTTLKKGDQVLLASNKPLKRRDFEIKAAEAQPLYVWSKVRSQNESEANVNVASSIASNGDWYGPGWYWDPFWADYAFIPGGGLLYSPFGWGFYSPGLAYLAPWGYGYGFFGGYYRHGYFGRGARVGGITTGVRSFRAGGFHGAGFAGGGFHGGGGRR